jgi:hypothetical protein
MSTHILDVSGARPLTSTLNDPAATRASVPAKQGDDVTFTIGGAKETRLVIPPGSRIQRRRYVRHQPKRADGEIVREGGEVVYEDVPYEEIVLVCNTGLTVFGRCSLVEPPEEGETAYEGHPNTNVVAKRYGPELHFTESGELVDDVPVGAFADEANARPE